MGFAAAIFSQSQALRRRAVAGALKERASTDAQGDPELGDHIDGGAMNPAFQGADTSAVPPGLIGQSLLGQMGVLDDDRRVSPIVVASDRVSACSEQAGQRLVRCALTPIGIETCPLSQRLHAGLSEAGFTVALEVRHVKAAMSVVIA